MGNWEFCSVESPSGDGGCIRKKGHKGTKHRDQFAYEWSDPGQVSGDRARAHQDEQLRELLTVIRNEAEMLDRMGYADNAGSAMHSVADRLAAILDGEQ